MVNIRKFKIYQSTLMCKFSVFVSPGCESLTYSSLICVFHLISTSSIVFLDISSDLLLLLSVLHSLWLQLYTFHFFSKMVPAIFVNILIQYKNWFQYNNNNNNNNNNNKNIIIIEISYDEETEYEWSSKININNLICFCFFISILKIPNKNDINSFCRSLHNGAILQKCIKMRDLSCPYTNTLTTLLCIKKLLDCTIVHQSDYIIGLVP